MPELLLDLILGQRACRRFDPSVDVPDADVETMLEAAVHAPSAENTQPWEFVVVREPALREAVAEVLRNAWESFGSEVVKATAAPSLWRDLDDGIGQGGLADAPVLIVVGADVERVDPSLAACSTFPAVQNLLLVAASLGYGSCLTTGLTTWFADDVRRLLALPSTIEPMAAVYVGGAARALGPPRRHPARDRMHRDRWGTPWAGAGAGAGSAAADAAREH